MQKRKVFFALLTCCTMVMGGCMGDGGGSAADFEAARSVQVIARESGSGTRAAFIELFGVEEKGEDGSKKDMTTREAVIANQTNVMMTNVSGNRYAIGYISLGSLNDTVKAVEIEGVPATATNVKNGTYPIARPFNIAVKDQISDLAQDFVAFILSSEGQAIIASSYIPVLDSASTYAGHKLSGKIVVAGSSSVTPIMEKLKEAYLKINTGAVIEIQESDSTAGMMSAMDGTCDIGMASRDLKDSELQQLTAIKIAVDGIAVIVNQGNPVTGFTKEQVRLLFTGAVTVWGDV